MKKADKYSVPDQVKLSGRLSEFRDALQEEIQEIESNGQNSTLLVGGHGIEAKGSGFWYRFLVEYMPLLPADTPCKLTIGTEQYDVTVISSNENEIILSSKVKLPANIGKAKLENGSTVLMERLIKCIEDNADKANPAGDRMFTGSDGSVYPVKQLCTYNEIHYAEHSNAAQKSAVKSALENDITYIWGPPGTGKTTVISTIINELFEHERSVLIVSHTNTAVDGAIIKVDKAYTQAHTDSRDDYPILRIGITPEGFPHNALLDSHVERLGKDLFEKKEALEKQQQEIREKLKEIQILFAKETWLKNSNLPELQGVCEILDQLRKKKISQEAALKRTCEEFDNRVHSHPKGVYLLQLEEDYLNKRNTLKTIQDDMASLKSEREQLIHDYLNTEDEIKKHSLYDELTLKVRRLMSEKFYQGKIDEAENAIKSLVRTIKTLTDKRHILQVSINKYESKGSVAKFFAGKTAYEQDQRSLTEINRNIQTNTDALHQKEDIRDDYQRQLKDLRLLQEKRQAVKPTKTIKYWSDEEQRLRRLLADIKTKLSSLEEQGNKLSSQIALIDFSKKNNQGFFDIIEMLQWKIDQYRKTIDETEEHIVHNQRILTDRLDEECGLCELFHEFQSRDEQEKIRELSALNEEVYEELRGVDMEEEQKWKESCEEELNQILAELSEIQKQMAELEKQAIMNARIVGTTLAKSYLSDVLRERQFDTVILDEASMASIPALWCAAYLAEKNIVIVGDFLQLPPIVMANTEMAKKWLGRDIFDHSGMKEMAKAKNKNIRPANFVMLNEQYRMEADIADIANLYYRQYTKLKSDDMNSFRVKNREIFYSWYSGKRTTDHVHLIDTESLHAWVTGIPQAKGHSRLNSFSATVDVALAFKCLDKYIDNKLYEDKEYAGTKVLIVAPYKPHVTLINKLIENEYRERQIPVEYYNLVKAGTIHSFQGSEADIVIFDLVVDEPHYKVGLFMPDQEISESAKKMFNVAVTRAKFKLYVVGDFKYCKSKARNNALSQLLSYLIDEKKYIKVDAKEQLLPKLSVLPVNSIGLPESPDAESIFLTENKFHDYFVSDIQSMQESMIIYSPFMTENRISVLLPVFYQAVSQGRRIVIITKPLEERPKSELEKYKKCEKGLRDIGVSILHKKGMHEKIIMIDDRIIWTGSLNALSYTGNTVEIMERRIDNSPDKTLINSYIKILDIKYLIEALERDYETKCPLCNSEMIIAESEDGGIYWRCVTGDYTRSKDQQYPVDGRLHCKVCNSLFTFSMKKQPRWVCEADPKHYQIVKKNDLKLPLMAELLFPADKKRVQEYFDKLTPK